MRAELAKIQLGLHADDASRLEDFKTRLYTKT
jgi:hypothetical protein